VTALVLPVLAASLLGSVHCAAMCGAFTCLYAGTAPGGGPGPAPLHHHAAYNLGRLGSYLVLALVAGATGVRLGGTATLAAGVVLVAWGAWAMLVAAGRRVPHVSVPTGWHRAMGSVVLRVRDRSPLVRASVTGLVTTLLPCGWMWAFVAVAVGTGTVLGALVVMTTFWVGTLPMMLAVASGAQRLVGRAATRLPLVTAGVIVALGLATIGAHLGVLPGTSALHAVLPAVPGAPSAHGAH
jgi:uncharacterized protein